MSRSGVHLYASAAFAVCASFFVVAAEVWCVVSLCARGHWSVSFMVAPATIAYLLPINAPLYDVLLPYVAESLSPYVPSCAPYVYGYHTLLAIIWDHGDDVSLRLLPGEPYQWLTTDYSDGEYGCIVGLICFWSLLMVFDGSFCRGAYVEVLANRSVSRVSVHVRIPYLSGRYVVQVKTSRLRFSTPLAILFDCRIACILNGLTCERIWSVAPAPSHLYPMILHGGSLTWFGSCMGPLRVTSVYPARKIIAVGAYASRILRLCSHVYSPDIDVDIEDGQFGRECVSVLYGRCVGVGVWSV